MCVGLSNSNGHLVDVLLKWVATATWRRVTGWVIKVWGAQHRLLALS